MGGALGYQPSDLGFDPRSKISVISSLGGHTCGSEPTIIGGPVCDVLYYDLVGR